MPCLQVAGLLLTGWVMWRSTQGLQWARVPLPWLMLRAAVYTVIACFAGAAITVLLYLAASQWEREDVIQATFRASSAAVWFAPCVILLIQLSPAAAIPALILVVNATHLLYIQWRVKQPPLETSTRHGTVRQCPTPRAQFLSRIRPRICRLRHPANRRLRRSAASSCAWPASRSPPALRWPLSSPWPRAASSRNRRKSMPRAFLGLALTILLAIGLTIGGMIPNMMRGPGGEGSTATTARRRTSLPGCRAMDRLDMPDASAGRLSPTPADSLASSSGRSQTHPYADRAHAADARWRRHSAVMPRPLSIPFSGEYWMFRWPYARPPKTSFFQRGSPAALSFSSTDHRPLQMEARHKLDQPVALSCCSAIRLEIRNADRYPGTISLELVLINNEQPGAPSLSLGHYNVTSRPDFSRDPIVPAHETLEFPIPATAALDSFNEFKIVFLRARVRMDKSAKLAIDRFILMPRIY